MSRALRRAAAWAAVGQLARVLDGIAPIAPLKGVLLDLEASPGRAARMADVDVLVPEASYLAAHDALERAGIRCVARDRDDRARTYSGGISATIDLHRRLFKSGLFRLPTTELFARARRDHETYDAPVWILDPLDTYAHLLGHAISGRQPASGRGRALADLDAWARHHGLEATRTARHLETVGMARAARLILPEAPRDPFAHSVLEALPKDPVGAALAPLARRALEPARSPLVRTLAVHALNESLPRGAASLASHLLHGAHQRWIDRDPPGITIDPQ
ncbi:MAG: nucleotidyltransferase family protein [Deltaproteobacteria bacterium]|nr:nucleotidyltransferase family protein [Deltaproteobacteria bacterium]